jgi:hypothetical protein
MLELIIALRLAAARCVTASYQRMLTSSADRRAAERGQATAEYALVLLGAATVALLLVAWAAKSGKVAALLDAVIDKVISQV